MLTALQVGHLSSDRQSALSSAALTGTEPSTLATLCIERALHIALPASVAAANMASADSAVRAGLLAVAFEWEGTAHTTPAIPLSAAASATWQYSTAVPVGRADTAEATHLQLKVRREPLPQ